MLTLYGMKPVPLDAILAKMTENNRLEKDSD